MDSDVLIHNNPIDGVRFFMYKKNCHQMIYLVPLLYLLLYTKGGLYRLPSPLKQYNTIYIHQLQKHFLFFIV